MNLKIEYRKYLKDGIEYIGKVNKVDERLFRETMEELCETRNISIFWQLRKNGEFFITINLSPAKICRGNIIE